MSTTSIIPNSGREHCGGSLAISIASDNTLPLETLCERKDRHSLQTSESSALEACEYANTVLCDLFSRVYDRGAFGSYSTGVTAHKPHRSPLALSPTTRCSMKPAGKLAEKGSLRSSVRHSESHLMSTDITATCSLGTHAPELASLSLQGGETKSSSTISSGLVAIIEGLSDQRDDFAANEAETWSHLRVIAVVLGVEQGQARVARNGP